MATFISGLGSPSAVHGDAATKAWQTAGRLLLNAHRKIVNGQCLDAHSDLWPAHKAIGEALAHSLTVDAPSKSAIRQMRLHVEEMDRETGKLFRERCIIRGG